MNKKTLILLFLNGLLILYLFAIIGIAYLHEKLTGKCNIQTPPAEIQNINPTFIIPSL